MNEIFIIGGVVLALILFLMGYGIGGNSIKKKVLSGELDIIGGETGEKMRQLQHENFKHVERWGKVGKLVHSFGMIPETDMLGQKLSRAITEEVMVNFGAVLLKTDDDKFAAIATEGMHAVSQEMLDLPVNDPLVRYMSTFPEAVIISSKDRQFKPFRRLRERVEEVLLMPLRVGEDVVGILWAGRIEGSDKFSDGQKAVLTFFGNSLGYLFRNRELVEEAKERALKIVTSLVKALEQKDEHTKGHSEHVAAYAEVFARFLGMEKRAVEVVKRAALLHDIGKIGIPEKILSKPDKLSLEEFEIMKSHPVFGAELLKTLGFLKEELLLILHHHEKYDGTGYPYGLSDERIPKGAVIISLADVFDALTSDQPFRKAYSIEEALEIMAKMENKHFEASMLASFLEFIKGRLKEQHQIAG